MVSYSFPSLVKQIAPLHVPAQTDEICIGLSAGGVGFGRCLYNLLKENHVCGGRHNFMWIFACCLARRRIRKDGAAVWEKEDYCHTPLAQERAAVLDSYFHDLRVEPDSRGRRGLEQDPNQITGFHSRSRTRVRGACGAVVYRDTRQRRSDPHALELLICERGREGGPERPQGHELGSSEPVRELVETPMLRNCRNQVNAIIVHLQPLPSGMTIWGRRFTSSFRQKASLWNLRRDSCRATKVPSLAASIWA
jgi:hypothetical protein